VLHICTHPRISLFIFPCICATLSAMTCVSSASGAGPRVGWRAGVRSGWYELRLTVHLYRCFNSAPVNRLTEQNFVMNDLREVIAEPLPFLEDLLWEWITVQERYVRLSKGKDALWWYNERSSLGALAGAVWRAGGVVLEEYSTEKVSRSRTGTRARAVGRGDMDFALGGREFVVEAKQCWPRIGGTQKQKATEYLKKNITAAKADVKRAHVERGSLRLAVVFATPRCLQKADSLDLCLENWVHAARSLNKYARAWIFPEACKNLCWPSKTGRIYPGGAVFIRALGKNVTC
jgi:hypothetical protein